MGRPSKLSEKQWAEIERRILGGEIPGHLADEFKINRSAVTRRFSQSVKTVKSVADQLLAAEGALRALPVAQQLNAINLADQLRSISGHLAGAANYGAATAHRLASIAHARAVKIKGDAGIDDAELRAVAALTRVANDASAIPLNLVRANQATMDDIAKTERGESDALTVEIVRFGPDGQNPCPGGQQ